MKNNDTNQQWNPNLLGDFSNPESSKIVSTFAKFPSCVLIFTFSEHPLAAKLRNSCRKFLVGVTEELGDGESKSLELSLITSTLEFPDSKILFFIY